MISYEKHNKDILKKGYIINNILLKIKYNKSLKLVDEGKVTEYVRTIAKKCHYDDYTIRFIEPYKGSHYKNPILIVNFINKKMMK